ncbi:amidase/aspartyl-tRNA(Asn)/glutamyl-tRNA(Gln) amidotransferase subunit A [Rhizobium sp. BK077]|uniref:amidase n=1 Tax=unclassified Rhizobium TaxID=2613769 RepID=UPI0017E4347E|nr:MULTISPECIES: amidase [unclassified Rhizobium]MBB3302206.1 amidase/aspartyl-tRNA(Asn)/glutamyl-tRNA(Gln) amidotransferase subunit A [Rhizobium sp. BK112]MBB3371328.1 amidase/aspartyl-tRNA(Asn)/glutamyl-tRNA(Gln) amidotransferase subunit A [Rhizobium sp. BK077]MBB4182184.1 amidase/aspartyl-tRNA(Asn)/glutamyl-tRNA(Gln) amidotransferase subunit A [Rhizobium sp. BK109]MBB4255613.1 amidase/aspartyl-tRNA(Asn)/glutamyl-tRNA(Gln) amidotransferase subunit A [Rhizobium sp. BK008]
MSTDRNFAGLASAASDLCFLDCHALTAAYQTGVLSPVDVARAALARAAEIEPFNAFTFLDADGALAAAAASEARWRAGAPASPVDGVPATLKDIVLVEGWAVRYGSSSTDAAVGRQDAPSVSRLRQAGAVFIGQTTTPEYGWKALTDSPSFGITRNPWDILRTPGGSSGGAAVAAACGAGVLHLGTDGGGSIRIPAAFTGIVGHKPTYGRVAANPPSSYGTVAHIGPLTRTVADAALMLEVMSGRDICDWTQAPTPVSPITASRIEWSGKRIGYWKTPCVGGVDAPVQVAVESALLDLEAAGASVMEIQLPHQDDLLEIFYRHWYIGAANRLSLIDAANYPTLDPGFLQAARLGQGYSGVERMAAEVQRSRYGAAMDALLVDFDFIISPTVPILPFEAGYDVPPGSGLGSWVEWSSFSFPINLSQQPACSVPCGLTQDGLPIGLQIIGARGADSAVLSAAMTYEKMFPARFPISPAKWPVAFGGNA